MVQDADCLMGERPVFLHDPLWRRSGPGKIDSSKWVIFSPHCIEASFGTKSYGVLYQRIVMSWFMFCPAAFLLTCWGGVHQLLCLMDTYLTGRLRAVPLPAAASTPIQLPTTTPCRTTATDPGGELPATALAERVGDFNQSMDPWERTGAAPQGWASHLHQSVLPVQGYIQLRSCK